jgi:hypothetical protein
MLLAKRLPGSSICVVAFFRLTAVPWQKGFSCRAGQPPSNRNVTENDFARRKRCDRRRSRHSIGLLLACLIGIHRSRIFDWSLVGVHPNSLVNPDEVREAAIPIRLPLYHNGRSDTIYANSRNVQAVIHIGHKMVPNSSETSKSGRIALSAFGECPDLIKLLRGPATRPFRKTIEHAVCLECLKCYTPSERSGDMSSPPSTQTFQCKSGAAGPCQRFARTGCKTTHPNTRRAGGLVLSSKEGNLEMISKKLEFL